MFLRTFPLSVLPVTVIFECSICRGSPHVISMSTQREWHQCILSVRFTLMFTIICGSIWWYICIYVSMFLASSLLLSILLVNSDRMYVVPKDGKPTMISAYQTSFVCSTDDWANTVAANTSTSRGCRRSTRRSALTTGPTPSRQILRLVGTAAAAPVVQH